MNSLQKVKGHTTQRIVRPSPTPGINELKKEKEKKVNGHTLQHHSQTITNTRNKWIKKEKGQWSHITAL